MSSSTLQALVFNLRHEATGIASVELRPVAPASAFPPVEAGAHIDLHLGNGLVRSYSLTNPGESHRYVVAVLNDKRSRGGSRYVHEQLRVGQTLTIGAPRNHFRLDETAPKSVLLAGGIGITPVYAMLQRLSVLRQPAHLIYCARSRAEAAFLASVESLVSASPSVLSVQYHFDDEHGTPPDLPRLLAGHDRGTHFYCCGPGPMLDAYERACEQLGQTHVHLERFAATAPVAPSVPATGYSVELRKSGKTVHVAPGVALLDAMLDAGLNPEYSCREGVCGACETKVIAGDVDHRDHLLSTQERAANKSMMICVSGCRSGSLVLDA
ncbi:PDR/VanB family oxidoreductase [Hydrogenophaga laconesensis]|uniref:Ferredoxin-NADP reductase n=1 Tax=Hydrogenophaga laconesensis TaxID=1805971 RepID=A0ABU1VFX9_9BURK|nr:PDR/VanB family oxidoreductase [Hydrogenophaga laconesensis]MDR7096367.1 ferredoxin-NADP reductase [Hydrogenophaga laconesensis]